MKTKRLAALILVLAMVLGLSACTPAAENSPTPTPAPANTENTQGKPEDSQGPAQLGFPTDTVTIICPYSAGGGTDLIARAMADWFSKKWGVSVIVDDKTGGGGAVGMSACAEAKADGHTIILTALAAATITPVVNDVGYTNKEFAPIAQVTEMTTALCVNPSSGITTLDELVAAGEKNFGAMTYGTTGATSFQNVLAQKYMSLIGKDGIFSHVPFDGGAAAITATVGNQTDIVVAMVPDLQSYVEAGSLTCLMVFSNERSEMMPDVPCAGELGYGDIAIPTWYGYMAPAGTPEEVLDFLDEQTKECLSDPEMVEILNNINQFPVYLDRETFTKLYQDTYDMNAELLGG